MSEQHQQVRRWCDEQKSGGRSLSVHFSGLDALSLSMTFTEVEEELARHGSLRHSLVQAEAPEDVAAPAEAAPEAAPPQAPPEAPVAAPKDRSLAASLVSAGALAAPPAVAAPVQPAPAPSERYEVMHALHGGMGVVYICYDHELDFAFAIKTFRKDAFVDRPDVLLSFLNETEIWTELRPQSNVVRAFGTRLIGSTPFLFLELVQGRNLRELLASTALAPAEAGEGGHQVLDGGDFYPVPFQRRGEAGVADVFRTRGNGYRGIEVGAHEDDAGILHRRTQREVYLLPGMQANPRGAYDVFKRALSDHPGQPSVYKKILYCRRETGGYYTNSVQMRTIFGCQYPPAGLARFAGSGPTWPRFPGRDQSAWRRRNAGMSR